MDIGPINLLPSFQVDNVDASTETSEERNQSSGGGAERRRTKKDTKETQKFDGQNKKTCSEPSETDLSRQLIDTEKLLKLLALKPPAILRVKEVFLNSSYIVKGEKTKKGSKKVA